MKNEVLKGSIILVFAGILCKLFGAFFRIPLTNIIGIEGMGAFQMIMSIYSFCLILCSGGVTIALSKTIAESKNDPKKISKSVNSCFLMTCLVGFLSGCVLFLLRDKIAYIQGVKEASSSYIFMLILVPIGAMIACLRGVAQGKGNMTPTGISQILEQLFKFFLGILFAGIFVQHGINWGVFGGFLGITVSEIVALLYLFLCIKLPGFEKGQTIQKDFFKVLIPIYLSSLIFPLVNAVDSILISRLLVKGGIGLQNAKILFGIESGVVASILNIPLIISSSVATAVLPNFSKIKEEKELFSKKVQEGGKILWLVLFPTVIGIVSICPQLYSILYPNFNEMELSYAVSLTRFGGILTIFNGVMQYIITIMEINDKLYKVFFFECLGGIANVVALTNLCVLGEVNIYGLLIARFLMVLCVCVFGAISLRKILYFNLKDFCLPIISGTVMFFLLGEISKVMKFSPIPTLLTLVFVGFFVYVGLIFPIIRDVFRKNEIFKQKNKTLD